MVARCNHHRGDDPVFCGVGRSGIASAVAASFAAAAVVPPLVDNRVRAVVVLALAPMAVVCSAESLVARCIPTAIDDAEIDRFFVPRFHADWVAQNVLVAQRWKISDAWHIAFINAASMPHGSEDGDISAEPPGFDRQAFTQQLGRELPVFLTRRFNKSVICAANPLAPGTVAPVAWLCNVLASLTPS